MSEQSRVPIEWRQPPARHHGKIIPTDELLMNEAAERFQFIASLGCGTGAIIAIGAAAIAWADPVARFLGL